MVPEARTAIEHNIFTPGNYFYNGVGHLCVSYDEVLAHGFDGIAKKQRTSLTAAVFRRRLYNKKLVFEICYKNGKCSVPLCAALQRSCL